MISPLKVLLDFYNNNIVRINAKQLDKKRTVNIICTENGKKIKLDKDTMTIYIGCKKSDGKYGLYDATILDDGSILWELKEQLLVNPGVQKADVCVVSTSGIKVEKLEDITSATDLGVALISTMPLYINVVPTIIDHEEVGSVSEIDALNKALKDLAYTEHHMRDFESDLNANEEERKTNEETRKQNEKDRISKEKERNDAEGIREQHEEERQRNETTRKEQESQRDINEQARVKAEDARSANETTRQQNEAIRDTNEQDRIKAENVRSANEEERYNNEEVRKLNEQVRITSENRRGIDTKDAIDRCNSATEAATNSSASADASKRSCDLAIENTKSIIKEATNTILECETSIANANNAATKANDAAKICQSVVDNASINYYEDDKERVIGYVYDVSGNTTELYRRTFRREVTESNIQELTDSDGKKVKQYVLETGLVGHTEEIGTIYNLYSVVNCQPGCVAQYSEGLNPLKDYYRLFYHYQGNIYVSFGEENPPRPFTIIVTMEYTKQDYPSKIH